MRSQLHYGAGAYICGEETALIESLEGKQVRQQAAAGGIGAAPSVGRPAGAAQALTTATPSDAAMLTSSWTAATLC
jgi:hypothetical protein